MIPPPKIRVLFDRKKEASKKKQGLIQFEIYYNGVRRYLSSGIKVYSGQYDDRIGVKNHPEATTLNERISSIRKKLNERINTLIGGGLPFSANDVVAIDVETKRYFIDYAEGWVDSHHAAIWTKRTYRSALNLFRNYNPKLYAHEISLSSIDGFDRYMKGKGLKQSSVASMHTHIHTILLSALKDGEITADPYTHFKISHGPKSQRTYLTKEEVARIEGLNVDGKMRKARDLFIFACYTGMAYADLMTFDFSDVESINGNYFFRSSRVKTKQPYRSMLLPPAINVLKSNNYQLPQLPLYEYNALLKKIANVAGINKNISSHAARHTFATWALSEGVPIERVSKMLGHTNIETTQIYANVLQKDVEDSFIFLSKRIKKGD